MQEITRVLFTQQTALINRTRRSSTTSWPCCSISSRYPRATSGHAASTEDRLRDYNDRAVLSLFDACGDGPQGKVFPTCRWCRAGSASTPPTAPISRP
jgi:hypothetical protein